jgi:hypothetical protein
MVFSDVQETVSGILIMNQPELKTSLIPYIRQSCRAQRIVVAIEKGFGLEFVTLTAYPDKEVEKVKSFPLLSAVNVEMLYTSSGGQRFCDISKANMISCPLCHCFTDITEEIQCMGCFRKPLLTRITGLWILQSVEEYKYCFTPLGLIGRELTFVQGSKILIYQTWYETPFFNLLYDLVIGQQVGLSGWMDAVTLEPARYFVNVLPQ